MPAHATGNLSGTYNTARFFVEHRQISWVLLIALFAWGVYGYLNLPKRKDPDMPVRVATAVTPWPGTTAAAIEQLVTRPIEETVAQNAAVHPPSATSFGIKSLTLPGLSVVQIQLAENVRDPEKEFSDINLRLAALNESLPQGAGPIQFNSGFGETSALLLTVASPKESEVELALRARDIARAIDAARADVSAGASGQQVAVVMALPRAVSPDILERSVEALGRYLEAHGMGKRVRPLRGPAFAGVDFETAADDAEVRARVVDFLSAPLGIGSFQPDAWTPVLIRDPRQTQAKLAAAGGDKYSYRELDEFTDLLARTLLQVPQVAKIQRSGVLPEQVFLAYSQERLAGYGIQPASIKQILDARNTVVPGGVAQIEGVNLVVEPSGPFASEREIGSVIVAKTSSGLPVYLRDLADVHRGYQTPARFLNFHTWRDDAGSWQRSRAVSLGIQMRAGEQIADFGRAVDRKLEETRVRLPADLVVARTSDQPRQVAENIDLFMTALYEAIVLVVIVAFLGFWEWRSAVLMMAAIPTTLAMTFGMMYVLGVELQQVSVATLIIALGLLVDDPVVAGDAIKRELAAATPRLTAAWLGPTRLATAILFATLTNVAAYLPILLLTGNQGDFLHSLPIVMACALVASRIVSMTFVPLLGYYLLRAPAEAPPPAEARRSRGFSGFYYRIGAAAIRHRGKVLVASLALLAAGVYCKRHLDNAFFPDDVQYLFYVDVWLPNNASLQATDAAARAAEAVIREVAGAYGSTRERAGDAVLAALTSFVGGGPPRFWFSVTPETQQQNYAQLIVQVGDKRDTPRLVGPLQEALSARVPEAVVDVQQIQTNPVPYPVAVRFTGLGTLGVTASDPDVDVLRRLSVAAQDILRAAPHAARVRDDWGGESLVLRLQVDADRANLAGVTNQDVAGSSAAALNGTQVGTLREGDKQIPIVARLRPRERAELDALKSLYVFATEDTNKLPLEAVASIDYRMQTQKIRRQDHFRMLTVFGFPQPGALPSEVFEPVRARFDELAQRLPPGYRLEISGEEAKTREGFGQLLNVMGISVLLIFVALVLQFRNAVKPLIVFAAVPYGVAGALGALYLTGTPFGFMAFLGIVSLIGVIVSHVIVLFDFIEELHAKGEPLVESLLDAGIVRLRPVLITVGATVIALVPLAIHGGPLWQPLCYAQIGGLLVATCVTLLLVPVIYAFVVLDLRLVTWETAPAAGGAAT